MIQPSGWQIQETPLYFPLFLNILLKQILIIL